MFISEAFTNKSINMAPNMITNLIPLIIFVVIFYLFLIRPQQQKAKKHLEMLKNLKKGDKVETAGGIIAIVKKKNEKDVVLEISDGVKVKVLLETIKSRID